MNMKKMNMAVAAAALLLMASCGTTKKICLLYTSPSPRD